MVEGEEEGKDPKAEDPMGGVVPRGDGRGWKEDAVAERDDLEAILGGAGREGAACWLARGRPMATPSMISMLLQPARFESTTRRE